MKHIAFTGWGSGGHITPIASLIEYGLQDTEIASQCKLFRFGENNSLEQKICNQFAEVTFISVPAGKLRRYRTPQAIRQNMKDMWKWIQWIIIAGQQLKKKKIDHLFCKWGYVALPVCIAAYILRIPISMHESDTHAGMTNRLVAKMTKNRFVWFPWILAPSNPIGQLLSPRLLTPDQEFLFELEKITKPIVLVMGGSQWAATLFTRLLNYLQTAAAGQFHFIVLLGSKNEVYTEQFAPYAWVTTLSFINQPEQMARLYQLSDLTITRGSATSLAEQHLFGIRKIIVPTPYTWGNHQWWNGVWYRDTYGDLLIRQDDHLDTELTDALHQFSTYKKQTTQPEQYLLETPLQIVRKTLLS
jgi:UDP-N-acetylglucosamine--N-acetylmuramyl-(pentapeptide) pyrophosphoryl-undecaprenol N-acetylglucosamine transferase